MNKYSSLSCLESVTFVYFLLFTARSIFRFFFFFFAKQLQGENDKVQVYIQSHHFLSKPKHISTQKLRETWQECEDKQFLTREGSKDVSQCRCGNVLHLLKHSVFNLHQTLKERVGGGAGARPVWPTCFFPGLNQTKCSRNQGRVFMAPLGDNYTKMLKDRGLTCRTWTYVQVGPQQTSTLWISAMSEPSSPSQKTWKRRVGSWTHPVPEGLTWPKSSPNYGQSALCRCTNMWEEDKQQLKSGKINQKCERLIQAKEDEGRAVWWGHDQHRMRPVWKHVAVAAALEAH